MAQPKRLVSEISANALAFTHLCFNLCNGEYSREDLRELSGVSDSAMRGWIKLLRTKNLVYIVEYRRRFKTGAHQIIYSWNHNFDFKDAPKPKRKSEAEYRKNYLANKARKQLYELASQRLSSSNIGSTPPN